MELTRFTNYWISELRPNDRFYFLNDKNKKVWQVEEVKTSFSNFIYCNIVNDLKQRRVIKQNKKIVFLRNG